MVPHIVFRAGPEQPCFPGPEWWDTAVSPAAPEQQAEIRALARISVAEFGPYTRPYTRALPDPSQRPANWDYDRYPGLVGLLRKYRYDDALLDLAEVAGASDEVRGQLTGWRDRGRAGLAGRFDPEAGLCGRRPRLAGPGR